jgi:hypothetical protein
LTIGKEGAICKKAKIFWNSFFCARKIGRPGSQVHGPEVGRSTMDPRPWGGAELIRARLAAAPVDGSSSRKCWEVAGVAENLISSEVWRRGDRVGRTTRPNCGGGRSSSAQGLERGGEEMGWGMATVEYCEVRGPFYTTGGWEGRQCSEGNGRQWSAPLMAFKSSFW